MREFEPDSDSGAALDERTIRLRNAAHYEAYKIVRILVFVVPLLILCFSTIWRSVSWLGAPIGLILALLALNLPQSLILWFEPDLEPFA